MNWLTQNWVLVLFAVAIAWFFFRGRLGSHSGRHGGLLGGMGHGGSGASYGNHGGHTDSRAADNAPEAAVDPVGGEAVRSAQALTSVYQGKIYYFASKENRDRFEAAPQEYARNAAGHPVHTAEAANERPRRRRGC